MTKYEYAGEMQELCFKISQVCKVLEEEGLQDFYHAASEGFAVIRNEYSVEEAQQLVTKDEKEQLESTAAYVKEMQKQAAEKLDQEIAI